MSDEQPPPGPPTPPGPAIPPPPPAYPTQPPPAPQQQWYPNPGLPQSHAPRFTDPRWEPAPSKQMAGWALGLAIVGCLCITALTAIGLAIAVLVRSRDGRDHGKGMAIAALIIAPIWIIFGVVSGVQDVLEGMRDESRDSTDFPSISSSDLPERGSDVFTVGGCLDYPALLDSDLEGELVTYTSATERPCSEPHDFEVFLVRDLAGVGYPGDKNATTQASRMCNRAFQEFVGVPLRRSVLLMTYLYPTEANWSLGDREVTCFVGRYDKKTTGSLAGSQA